MSDKDDHGPKTPTATDVLAGVNPASPPSQVSEKEKSFAEKFKTRAIDSQVAYAHLKGIQDHYKHKGRWSVFLMCAIAGMLIFQSVLLVSVGTGRWDFSEYEWLLPALLVQNLTQVVGLSVWAVKYLFSDISKQRPETD